MKLEQVRLFIGLPVIVQLRDAMALGSVAGPLVGAAVCNWKGEVLFSDGTVAPPETEHNDARLARRPAWQIAVRLDAAQAPEFRFAIEGAMVSMVERPTKGDPLYLEQETGPLNLVRITYFEGKSGFELVVEPEAIVGITCVRQGPMPEEEPGLVKLARN